MPEQLYSKDIKRGLWTPNDAFFIEFQHFWAWVDKLGR